MMQLSQPFPSFPSAFAAFASLQSPHIQSLLQSQIAALQSHNLSIVTRQNETKRTTNEYILPRKRVGGSTMKTAKVWRFFDELPSPEQAAECRLCKKKIKATNSSTTGMIRHLRSCHSNEYLQVQEARQNTIIQKMEEKARAELLREMNEKVASNMAAHITNKESQKSPSASSSASDTASSSASSLFGQTPILHLPPIPTSLPAPKPLKIYPINKTESTDAEEEIKEDLNERTSAFAALPKREEVHNLSEEKINTQMALWLLLDQLPLQIVDRPGFQAFIRLLLPHYSLPSSASFQSEICPSVHNQLRRQLGSLFAINNPISNPFASMPDLLKCDTVMDSSIEGSFTTADSKTDKKECESDCSSVESEFDMSAKIESLLDYIGRYNFPKDDVISLVNICRSVFTYFEDRPSLLNHLSLSLPSIDSSLPSLLSSLYFVSSNSSKIDEYIRHTPDMDILPISDNQNKLLYHLITHINNKQECLSSQS